MNILRKYKIDLILLFSVLILICLIDAAAGGGISIVLNLDRFWSPLDQKVNDLYQFVMGALVLYLLGAIFIVSRIAATFLFLAFVFMLNETLFYLFQPFVSEFHEWIIGPGMGRESLYFPDVISGWPGWIARTFSGQNITLSFKHVIALNIEWLIVLIFFLIIDYIFSRRKKSENPAQPDYETRLDQLFAEAFAGNHPAMLDYTRIKFELRRLRIDQHAQGKKQWRPRPENSPPPRRPEPPTQHTEVS